MAKHKVATIGLGSWAEKIVRTLGQMDNIELVAACQRKSDRPSWLPASCHLYDNINDLLRKSILTHVITALPPQAHLEVAKKVSQYGLPIWLEKPIALSYKETQAIFDLDASIFVNHIHLYSECWNYFCNEVSNKITSNSIIRTEGFTYGINPKHDFSILYDVGPHDLSMLFSLFDDITVENIHLTESKNGDHYSIEMQSNTGCNIFTRIGNDGSQEKKRIFEIDIDVENTYTYDGLQQKVFYNGNEVFVAKTRPLEHAINAFVSGEQVDEEKTLKMMKILDEIETRIKR